MYENIGQGNTLGLGNVGDFADKPYWSSTEIDIDGALLKDFDGGYVYFYFGVPSKQDLRHVRAVRAF